MTPTEIALQRAQRALNALMYATPAALPPGRIDKRVQDRRRAKAARVIAARDAAYAAHQASPEVRAEIAARLASIFAREVEEAVRAKA